MVEGEKISRSFSPLVFPSPIIFPYLDSHPCISSTRIGSWGLIPSVTRWVNLLDFAQLFKAFANIQFAQISHIVRQFFCIGVRIYHFSIKIVFGQLLWTFGDFLWSHCLYLLR